MGTASPSHKCGLSDCALTRLLAFGMNRQQIIALIQNFDWTNRDKARAALLLTEDNVEILRFLEPDVLKEAALELISQSQS